jgi:uncharacterized protein YjbJ (UPF0337 family)
MPGKLAAPSPGRRAKCMYARADSHPGSNTISWRRGPLIRTDQTAQRRRSTALTLDYRDAARFLLICHSAARACLGRARVSDWATSDRRPGMNTDIAAGKWKQMKGEVKRQWGKLTDDDIDQIDGNNEKLLGIVQERYGKSRDEAERDVKEWRKRQDA